MHICMGANLMLKINLVAIGDIKEKYLKDAISEYSKRLTRFCELKIIELKENTDKNPQTALKKDENSILPHLRGHVIVLAVEGKAISSPELAQKIKKLTLTTNEITFIIGASNGLSDTIKNKADELISFSRLTYPHQLMRVIFLEQIYRAFTIINNISYHK